MILFGHHRSFVLLQVSRVTPTLNLEWQQSPLKNSPAKKLFLQAHPVARTGPAQRHLARGRGPSVHELRGRRPQGVAVPGQGQHHQQHRLLRVRQRGAHRQGLPAEEARYRLRPRRGTHQDQDGRRGRITNLCFCLPFVYSFESISVFVSDGRVGRRSPSSTQGRQAALRWRRRWRRRRRIWQRPRLSDV